MACFLYLSLLTPPHLLHHLPFTHWFQCYHGDTCLSHLPATCFACHPVSLRVSLSLSLSPSLVVFVCRWIFVCPWLAFLCWLFVCLFSFTYLQDCLCVGLAVPLHPSLSVFAFCLTHFSPSLRLTGCLSGHQAFPPLIPPSSSLSARLLCSVVPLTPSLHSVFSVFSFYSFSPPWLVCLFPHQNSMHSMSLGTRKKKKEFFLQTAAVAMATQLLDLLGRERDE